MRIQRALARSGVASRRRADELLQRAFTPERPRRSAARAATLLRANAKRLVASVARALSVEPYCARQVLRMLVERSTSLRLYVRGNRRDALRYARWMLERLTGTYSQGETPHLPL